MRILITNQNIEFFKTLVPKAKFTLATNNTSTFNVSEEKFSKLYTAVKEKGLNPFAVMSW